jgi:acyl carrier protein
MNFSELEPLLKRVFPDELNFSIEMTKGEIESWDSMGHLNLILEVEDTFDVSFTKDEIEGIDTLEILLDHITKKLTKN